MTNITIMHNPRCRKSRETLHLLETKGYTPEIFEYLKNPLNESELREVSKKLGLRPKDFIRKNEAEFKENKLRESLENDNELFKQMALHPKLIERPIVMYKDKAKIGRPPEQVLDLF
ncbi:arsenate reductase (glutaredoxin) [Candidatus Neomarinimicrobiota bacterium]